MMYESEKAPEVLKETARQHPREVQVTSEMLTVPCNPTPSEEHTITQKTEIPPNPPEQKTEDHQNSPKVESTSPTKTLTETVTSKLAPAYATISEKTRNIAAKFQSLSVSTPDAQQQGSTDTNNLQTYDKGVSVKEYLFQKFEPGDDEKALSKAITEVISPKKSPDGKSVVEKMKEAVSALIKTDEATLTKGAQLEAIQPATSSVNKARDVKSASNYAASSSYVKEDMEEESHGRILQAN